MAIAEAPRGATIDPADSAPVLAPLRRRERRRIEKEVLKVQRTAFAANHLQEITERSFPDEDEKLNRYASFIEHVKSGEQIDFRTALTFGIEFGRLWNADPTSIRRKAEKSLREAARNAGNDQHGELSKWRFSSFGNSADIIGQGQLPTNLREARKRIKDEQDPDTKRLLEEYSDQIELAKKTKGTRTMGIEAEAGIAYTAGLNVFSANIGMNGGVNIEPKDPEIGRKIDAFVAPRGKVAVFSRAKIRGFRERGKEKSYSILGLSYSEGHPYRGDQVKTKLGPVETAFGETKSGVTLEAPVIMLVPFLMSIGAHELASSIASLGIHSVFIEPQVVVNFQDERLRPVQEKMAKVSARANAWLKVRRNTENPKSAQDKIVV